MGGIEYHRTTGFAHHDQRPHIRNQIVIAKRSTTLADHDLFVACSPGFVDYIDHFPGAEKLPFFDVHRDTGLCHAGNEIGLATQKSRCLQHIDYGCHSLHIGVFMHIGEYRHTNLLFDFGQNS